MANGYVELDLPIGLPLRGPPTAYALSWRSPAMAVPEDEEIPEGKRYYPERALDAARLFRRTAPSAYDILIPLATEEHPVGAQLFPDRAPGYRRAAQDTYWAEVVHGRMEELPTPGTSFFDERPRPYRRAAELAYWIKTPPTFTPEADPMPEGYQLLPSRAPGYRRAANHAYLTLNKLMVEPFQALCDVPRRRPDESDSNRLRASDCVTEV